MTAQQISEDQLREMFELMRERHQQWPDSYDQVMADPQRGRLVRLNATARARALQGRSGRAICDQVAPRPCPPHRYPPMPRPTPFDHKRAAAGERDDE